VATAGQLVQVGRMHDDSSAATERQPRGERKKDLRRSTKIYICEDLRRSTKIYSRRALRGHSVNEDHRSQGAKQLRSSPQHAALGQSGPSRPARLPVPVKLPTSSSPSLEHPCVCCTCKSWCSAWPTSTTGRQPLRRPWPPCEPCAETLAGPPPPPSPLLDRCARSSRATARCASAAVAVTPVRSSAVTPAASRTDEAQRGAFLGIFLAFLGILFAA
jgi:hypothetical protein